MADQFVNGLNLRAPTASQCGRTFSRWLVEWLTQYCGWTIHDNITGNWTPTVATGTAGATVTSYPTRFDITGDAYSFTSSDVGAYLTIKGFSEDRFLSRNGIYKIIKLITSKIVDLDVQHSMHEDGFAPGYSGLTWRLWRPTTDYVPTNGNVMVLKGRGTVGAGYDFHLHINVRNTNSYFPEFIMSPFATWDAGTHSWIGSDKRTSAVGIDNVSSSLSNTDSVRIWAAGDSDRAVIMMRVEDDYYSWHLIYLGEIDPKDAVNDPKPCILWSGSNAGSSTPADDLSTLIGYGCAGTVNSGGRWLAFDDLTTVTGYAMIANVPATSDVNWLGDEERWWGEPQRARYRQPILCECRTSGFMEVRGALRRVWATGRNTPRLHALGVNGEFLHTKGGILLPWCNTKAWYER